MDKRVPFFVVAGVVCLLLIPLADHEHRWVALTTAVAYLVFAVLFALDSWSRRQANRPRK